MKKNIISIGFIIVLGYIILSCTTEPEDITLYNNPASPSYAAQTNKSIGQPGVSYLGYNGSQILVSFNNNAIQSWRRFVMDLKSDGSTVLSSHIFNYNTYWNLYDNIGFFEVNKSAGSSYSVTALCKDPQGIGTTSTNNASGVVPSLPASTSRIGSIKGIITDDTTGNGIAGLTVVGLNNNNKYYTKTTTGNGGYYTLTGLATNGYGIGNNIDITVLERLTNGVYILLNLTFPTTLSVGSQQVITNFSVFSVQ